MQHYLFTQILNRHRAALTQLCKYALSDFSVLLWAKLKVYKINTNLQYKYRTNAHAFYRTLDHVACNSRQKNEAFPRLNVYLCSWGLIITNHLCISLKTETQSSTLRSRYYSLMKWKIDWLFFHWTERSPWQLSYISTYLQIINTSVQHYWHPIYTHKNDRKKGSRSWFYDLINSQLLQFYQYLGK